MTGGFEEARRRLGLTHLYSFDSSFAEVPLHLNVDLHVADVAGKRRESCHDACQKQKSPKKSINERSPDVKI